MSDFLDYKKIWQEGIFVLYKAMPKIKGAEEYREALFLVPVDRLIPLEKNARVHSARNIKDIANSLRLHGQQTPLTVDSKNIVRKGNGTLLAAKELGWTKVLVKPYSKGFNGNTEESEEKLRAYQVQDNRSAETSEWDYETLKEDFVHLEEAGYQLEEMGWLPYEAGPIREATFMQKEAENLEEFNATMQGRPIALTQVQRGVFERAYERLKKVTDTDDMTEGRAVELLSAEFLSGSKE